MLGPPDGRYLGARREHIVVIQTLGAAERRRLARRRSRDAAPEPDPVPVPTTRATVIAAEPTAEPADWLRRAGSEEAQRLLGVLNRLLHAHRLATADPHVDSVSLEQALVVRVGHGSGEEVADGRWSEARELVPAQEAGSRRRRVSFLRPQERLAALFGGRAEALQAEELALRARADLDAGRTALAALMLDGALAVLERELEPTAALSGRVAELRELAPGVHAAREAGTGAEPEVLAHALSRLEALLRARAMAN